MGLNGKTVLLTRARKQNASLRQVLEKFGAHVIEVPTIEIVEPATWKYVDHAIEHLTDYDWVIFTSANAVDAFLGRAAASVLVKVAAVGPQTARRLEERGQHVDLIPNDFRSEGLLQSFPRNLNGVRILLPRAEVATEALPSEMRKRGAAVDEISVYRTRRPDQGRNELRQLLDQQKIDCITFTSGSTVQHLIDMLDHADPLSLLSHPAVAVIGPMTRRAASAAGLQVDIEAKTATVAALATAICDYFERND